MACCGQGEDVRSPQASVSYVFIWSKLMNRYTWGTFPGQTCSELAAVWTITKYPKSLVIIHVFFNTTVNVHQLSGCLTNRTMCSSKFEKGLSSDVCDCVSELKEKLCVKTMCAKEPPPEIPSQNSDVTSELPPQICLLIGWSQRVGSKWGLLEQWLYKRHPISQERYREREKKGKPVPPVAVGRLSEEGKELLCTVFICR